jgi:predicted DNA-binding transcriptional regulator AlpA
MSTADVQFLRFEDVAGMFPTPISRTTMRRWVATGAFPSPVHLGSTRSIFWRKADVEAWLAKSSPVASVSP